MTTTTTTVLLKTKAMRRNDRDQKSAKRCDKAKVIKEGLHFALVIKKSCDPESNFMTF